MKGLRIPGGFAKNLLDLGEISQADYDVLVSKKSNKYHAKKTEVDGIVFRSKKEAERYSELKMLERAGEITYLRLQVPFELSVRGKKICRYVADFTYRDHGEIVVEDSKGVRTPEYKIKKKLMLAVYGIKIKET